MLNIEEIKKARDITWVDFWKYEHMSFVHRILRFISGKAALFIILQVVMFFVELIIIK